MTKRKNAKKKNRAMIIIAAILIIFEIVVFSLGYCLGMHVAQKKLVSEDKASQTEIEKPVEKAEKEPEINNPEKTDDNSKSENKQTEKTDKKVEKLMNKMSLSDKVYQMMFVTPESLTNMGQVIRAGDSTKKALKEKPVGGIVYFSQNFETPEQTKEMIENTQSFSEIPLFISVDEEGGRVSRLGSNPAMGVKQHPPMRTIGNTANLNEALKVGRELGKDLKNLGFNMDFAPVADITVNTENTEIGDRSFGSDPETVGLMVESLVKGLKEEGVLSSLKHFPGHGSTYVDSHSGYSESTRTIDELRSAEFIPFKKGIDAGAEFVMVSHMTLTNTAMEKIPSSISKEVITDLLLNELQFKGIVITDSFQMGAITEEYSISDAVVRAVNAGVDMILMPSDLISSHDAIVTAVENGKISEERINESVRKILQLKSDRGIL